MNSRQNIVPHIEYHTGLNAIYSDETERKKIFSKFKKGEGDFYVPDRKEICKIGRNIDFNDVMDVEEDKKRVSMEIPDQNQIYHILGNNEVSKRIIRVLEYGSIDESENVINSFSVESEFKVLDINLEKLLGRLSMLGYEKVYETMIHDVYNDYVSKDRRLDNHKAIHRNRYKIQKSNFSDPLLTLKRKEKEGEQKIAGLDARICYEREYIIKRMRQALYTFQGIGFHPQREKIKYRWAFKLERDDGIIVKVDIDKYSGIPYIAELELSRVGDSGEGIVFGDSEEDEKIVQDILKSLGLDCCRTVGWGSRKLHIEYNVDYPTIFT